MLPSLLMDTVLPNLLVALPEILSTFIHELPLYCHIFAKPTLLLFAVCPGPLATRMVPSPLIATFCMYDVPTPPAMSLPSWFHDPPISPGVEYWYTFVIPVALKPAAPTAIMLPSSLNDGVCVRLSA